MEEQERKKLDAIEEQEKKAIQELLEEQLKDWGREQKDKGSS